MNGWSLESGYRTNAASSFPFRVSGSGVANSLDIILILNKWGDNQLCNDWVQGFKVFLHTPGEVIHNVHNFIVLSLMNQLYISVKPNMMNTSEELRSYSANE